MSQLGQKCPKRLRLPAGKNAHEHMGRIVPKGDLPSLRFPEDVGRFRPVATIEPQGVWGGPLRMSRQIQCVAESRLLASRVIAAIIENNHQK
jgi:hypothetical protein